MADSEYTPPKVWTWDTESGGKFANINRPISGATHDKPRVRHMKVLNRSSHWSELCRLFML